MENLQTARTQFINGYNLNHGGSKSPESYRAELVRQAPHNPYARQQLQGARRTDVSLESSRSSTTQAEADVYQSCADATNFVGDVFTAGAHRNIPEMHQALADRDLRKFAIANVKFQAKVGGAAILGSSRFLGQQATAKSLQLGLTADEAGKVGMGLTGLTHGLHQLEVLNQLRQAQPLRHSTVEAKH